MNVLIVFIYDHPSEVSYFAGVFPDDFNGKQAAFIAGERELKSWGGSHFSVYRSPFGVPVCETRDLEKVEKE